jgi:ADP-ribosyl-[dinitrogen reductase] hydrolase
VLFGARLLVMLSVYRLKFTTREERVLDTVDNMLGYGTYHQPSGTWSDDSSMMLCTIEGLLVGGDPETIGELFVKWAKENHWTPWGKVFDIGVATRKAIHRIRQGVPSVDAGGTQEYDNGNGSLMRILPIGLWFASEDVDQLIEHACNISSITHRHPRSQLACGIYCIFVKELLSCFSKEEAYKNLRKNVVKLDFRKEHETQLEYFSRILNSDIGKLPEHQINSSGYVVDTLEASIWCLLNSSSYEEAVLKAVNLGGDTDTTGIVTGGLAGLVYGQESIPEKWLRRLAKFVEISELFDQFSMDVL